MFGVTAIKLRKCGLRRVWSARFVLVEMPRAYALRKINRALRFSLNLMAVTLGVGMMRIIDKRLTGMINVFNCCTKRRRLHYSKEIGLKTRDWGNHGFARQRQMPH
jgi:hypothetical protein